MLLGLDAAMGAFKAFNEFLCTPEGQKFAAAFNTLVGNLLTALHVHLNVAPAAPKS